MSIINWLRSLRRNKDEDLLALARQAAALPALASMPAAAALAEPMADLSGSALPALDLMPATDEAAAAPDTDPSLEALDSDLLRSAFEEAEASASSQVHLATQVEAVDCLSLLDEATQVMAMARLQ